jgi:hypothetical protein
MTIRLRVCPSNKVVYYNAVLEFLGLLETRRDGVTQTSGSNQLLRIFTDHLLRQFYCSILPVLVNLLNTMGSKHGATSPTTGRTKAAKEKRSKGKKKADKRRKKSKVQKKAVEAAFKEALKFVWLGTKPQQAPDWLGEQVALLKEKLTVKRIDEIDVSHFPGLCFEALWGEHNIALQEGLTRICIQRVLWAENPGTIQEPRKLQVKSLRRLVFGRGDTLLIAMTGFGKSAILHTFAVMTGRQTIQIIPLNKLGDEQRDAIAKIPGTSPVLLRSDSKKDKKALIEQIIHGDCTHILLSPEQAAHPQFRKALKHPAVQARIGLVAIDEVHLVQQWGEGFRKEFAMLGELRQILRKDTIWFGCTATLDLEGQDFVLKHAGFRRVGPNPYQTQVYRSSVNRVDVKVVVLKYKRGEAKAYGKTKFMLKEAFDPDKGATPEKLPKVIFFANTINGTTDCMRIIRDLLIDSTKDCTTGPKYNTDLKDKKYGVHHVVQSFTSRVAEWDKDARYAEFSKSDSSIRIMVATCSLGTGCNIPDVSVIVIWDMPILEKPLDKKKRFNGALELKRKLQKTAEHWQKLGRGARGKDRTSICYIFLPWWLFDDEGVDPIKKPPLHGGTAPTTPIRGRTTTKASTKNQTRAQRSASRNACESDIEDIATEAESDAEDETGEKSQRTADGQHIWNKSELAHRAVTQQVWFDIANGACKRKPFLIDLGEMGVPKEDRLIAANIDCCNGCNPELTPKIEAASPTTPSVTKPGPKSIAGVVLIQLTSWLKEQAALSAHHSNRRIALPSWRFMPPPIAWELSRLFTNPTSRSNHVWWYELCVESLLEKTSLLASWTRLDTHGEQLVTTLKDCLREQLKMDVEKKRIAAEKAAKVQAAKAAKDSNATGIKDVPKARTGDGLFKQVQIMKINESADRLISGAQQDTTVDSTRGRSPTPRPSTPVNTTPLKPSQIPLTTPSAWDRRAAALEVRASQAPLEPRPGQSSPDELIALRLRAAELMRRREEAVAPPVSRLRFQELDASTIEVPETQQQDVLTAESVEDVSSEVQVRGPQPDDPILESQLEDVIPDTQLEDSSTPQPSSPMAAAIPKLPVKKKSPPPKKPSIAKAAPARKVLAEKDPNPRNISRKRAATQTSMDQDSPAKRSTRTRPDTRAT